MACRVVPAPAAHAVAVASCSGGNAARCEGRRRGGTGGGGRQRQHCFAAQRSLCVAAWHCRLVEMSSSIQCFGLCICRHSSSSTASRSTATQLPRWRRDARIAAASQPPNIDLDALLGELQAPEIDADLATLQAEQVRAACWMDEGRIACLPAWLFPPAVAVVRLPRLVLLASRGLHAALQAPNNTLAALLLSWTGCCV